MSARHWTSSTAPASSTTARCCSPEARPSWSPTRTCAVSISARASSCRVGMSIGPRLDLRQSQSLVMTPQLQQAIRLLALSNLEVESFIAEEIEKNPLLEADRGGGDDEAPTVESAPNELLAEAPESPPEVDSAGGETALDVDLDSEDFHQDSAADSLRGLDGGLGLAGTGSGGSGSLEGPDFDSFECDQVSLHDHLLHQAGEILSGADLVIAAQIIEQIDETGYF